MYNESQSLQNPLLLSAIIPVEQAIHPHYYKHSPS